MKKKVIIVTGSCGRIGKAVVRQLGQEYRMVGFELLKAFYASENEELVPVDISSDESVHQAFHHIRNFYGDEIASVIHLAAYYSFDQKESDLYEKITVQGTRRLLEALQNFKVEQFIFSSTMLVHKPCEPNQSINEESPVVPTWGYPASKVKTEKLIHEKRGNIPTVNLRIAGVYTDYCDSIPISNQIQRIYEKQLTSHFFPGNITHGASFVHMDDLVSAICACVQKRTELPAELTLLIGEDKTLSYDYLQRFMSRHIFGKEIKTFQIPKFLAMIGAWLQGHIPFMPKPFIKPWMIAIADDNYTLDVSKAKKVIQWTPKHNLEETLPKMIAELESNPAIWYKNHHLTAPKWLKKKAKRSDQL